MIRRVRIVFWLGLAKALGTATVKCSAWRDAAGARGMQLIMQPTTRAQPKP